MIKEIKPWLENLYVFEGHTHSPEVEGRSLSLEKLALMVKSIENKSSFEPVNMIHYTTNRIKKSGKFKRKKEIRTHNYDIAFSAIGKTQFDGGHHRAFSHIIAKSPLKIKEINDDSWEDFFYSKIPEKVKTSYRNVTIESRLDRIENLSILPEELKNPQKIPNKDEIKRFFDERINTKISYQDIINNLYKK